MLLFPCGVKTLGNPFGLGSKGVKTLGNPFGVGSKGVKTLGNPFGLGSKGVKTPNGKTNTPRKRLPNPHRPKETVLAVVISQHRLFRAVRVRRGLDLLCYFFRLALKHNMSRLWEQIIQIEPINGIPPINSIDDAKNG